MININAQLIEIASWRIVSELLRCYPGRFILIETHPGGGQYDCLAIYTKDLKHIADFNHVGSLHIFNRLDGRQVMQEPMDIWLALITEKRPQKVLDEVCTKLGLLITKRVPSSTPEIITYRFIAAFLASTTFGRDKWECRNGMFDTSGSGGGGVRGDFKKFSGAKKRLQVRLPGDVLGEPAYRFWFLRRNETPLLCFEITGTVWAENGTSFDLMDIYKKERRIWPVINKVAGHLLP